MTKECEIATGGQLINIDQLSETLAKLDFPQFVETLRTIIEKRGSDQLKLLIDGLQIQATPSAFTPDKADQIIILEKVAKTYPFSRWLESQGVATTAATRTHLCQWWDSLMMMASEHGYVPGGQINQVSRSTNLWNATGPLAAKMQADPARYRFLPALLINHAQEVTRVLDVIGEAEPFVEVLTGERIEDLRRSRIFLGSFSIVQSEDGSVIRTIADTLFSVQLILQRG